jgi:hypothetical protein
MRSGTKSTAKTNLTEGSPVAPYAFDIEAVIRSRQKFYAVVQTDSASGKFPPLPAVSQKADRTVTVSAHRPEAESSE